MLQHETEPTIPSRVLDVSDDQIRLYSPASVERGQYVTLSHCWGVLPRSERHYHTTLSSLEKAHREIAWDLLPPLYQDVVALTRSLGIRFLWIDSLCIVQDDVKDWAEQAAQMGSIYSGAKCNIAATASSSAEQGLFRDRFHSLGGIAFDFVNHIPLTDFEVKVQDKSGDVKRVFVRQAHTREHDNFHSRSQSVRDDEVPLLKRAWIFQERLLSRRTIHISASELLWECRSAAWCECGGLIAGPLLKSTTSAAEDHLEKQGQSKQPTFKVLFSSIKSIFAALGRGHLTPVQAMELWSVVLHEYTMLELTFESDRCIALAGVAQQFQLMTGYTYLAGLWLEDLPRGLCWNGSGFFLDDDYAARKIRLRRTEENFRYAEEPNAAPSWSWMSRAVDSASTRVSFYYAPVNEFKADARVVIHPEGTSCECRDNNPFAEVLSGQLDITAAYLEGSLAGFAMSDPLLPKQMAVRINSLAQPLALTYDHRGPRLRLDAWIGTNVTCILLGRARGLQLGLVLEAVSGDEGVFRVIGTHRGSISSEMTFADFPRIDGRWEAAEVPIRRFKIV
jgi:hypothetical protein